MRLNITIHAHHKNRCHWSSRLSSLQKIIAAYKILAFKTPVDSMDEYIIIRKSTVIESLRRFIKSVIVMFGDHYLRSPNNIDIASLLQTGA